MWSYLPTLDQIQIVTAQCTCLLCKIGSKAGFEKHPLWDEQFQTGGPPANKKPTTTNEKQDLSRCPDCFSLLGQGIKHTCTKTSSVDNLYDYYKDKPDVVEAVAAKIIREKRDEGNEAITLKNTYGKPTVVSQSKEKVEVSIDDLVQLQNKSTLTDKSTKDVAAVLNKS